MFGKKLLTFACALGILAIGACFLPPLPEHRTPAPPPPVSVHGVHSICVKVTNVSETHHIDPVTFGRWIVEAINRSRQPGWPRAHVGEPNNSGDAILQVSIENESAIPDQANNAQPNPRYTYTLWVDAELLTPSGLVIWKDSRPDYLSRGLLLAETGDPWRSTRFARWVHDYVCAVLVARTLFEVH